MKSPHPFSRLLAGLVFTFGALTASQAAPRYQVIDLGSLGGPHTYFNFSGLPGRYLNERGVVAAGMETADDDPLCFNGGGCFASHGFLWHDGALSDLGVLVPGDQANFSQSVSINDQNHCVGASSFNTAGDEGIPLLRAVIWKFRQGADPELIDLGTLGGSQSFAHTINNQNQVAGWALNQTAADINIWEDYPSLGTQQRAVLWENGAVQDLGTLGGTSAWAIHINDRGQIIGQSYTDIEGSEHHTVEDLNWSRPVAGFLWENGKMVDLGTVGGTFMLPIHINNQGQIIGLMTLDGDSAYHPFLWANGVIQDLGSFGGKHGRADAINERGEVVGGANMENGSNRAFLWRNGVLKNLGALGANSHAWGVNAKTQIVGTTGSNSGDFRAFLWEDNGEPMHDLNALVPDGSPHLALGLNINDRGEILVSAANEQGLYLLVPLPTLSIRLSESPAGRRIVVEAQTTPGRNYRLESSTDLKSWTTVGAVFVADQETMTKELELQEDSSFYRLAGPLF